MDILYRCLEYPKYVPPGIFRIEWVNMCRAMELNDENKKVVMNKSEGEISNFFPHPATGEISLEKSIRFDIFSPCKGIKI